ncbi:hypothetical protein JOQ06_003994 [Pogonophryne albipinna]|uniref:Uncharacterized protein n=1 Tax=Pogonophryne albipinna TaxID=1090488 RepID=A0AAD6ADI0_9TELE|nr:hypothetical protein JOQ06_003994 [Pogonophryne albipinna]
MYRALIPPLCCLTESVTLRGFLVLSVALNALLPLFVFLFMRRRQKQNLWRSDRESRIELLQNINMGNDAVGEETKA